MQISIDIQLLDKNAILPTYATNGSAGMDIHANLQQDILLKPQTRELIPTGIAIALPVGFEAQIRPRSGIAFKNGVTVLNSPGTIDSDYRGEIKVLLINHSTEDFTVTHGMRIAQMIIARYEYTTWNTVISLSETIRGDGGFGSTGLLKKIS